MSGSPLISIVVPCFNHGRFLKESLDSIGASARGVEVVIVDDGSTDGSASIADDSARRAVNGTRVRAVHQARSGVSAARNRGLAESRGAFVVFLDADDHLAANALEVGARALEEHPEAVFVYGRCQMMDGDGTLLATPLLPRIERHPYHELLRNNYIWTPANVMFRRGVLERCGAFDVAMSGSADYELYLRIARTYPIRDHGQLVAHYRRHGANMSSNAAHMLRETLAVLKRQWPYVDGDPEAAAAYREGWRHWQEFYGSHLVNEIRAHARGKQWAAAVRKAFVLGALHPRGLAHHARQKLRRTLELRRPGDARA